MASQVIHSCDVCNVVVTLEFASHMQLILELQERAFNQAGSFSGRDKAHLKQLAKSLNPLPIDIPSEVLAAVEWLEKLGYGVIR